MVVGEMVLECGLAIVGAGPGGYTAALRAAELGIKAVIIDTNPKLGGVCLHVGCIPSKALLHAAEVMNETKQAASFGLHFSDPKINVDELRKASRTNLHKASPPSARVPEWTSFTDALNSKTQKVLESTAKVSLLSALSSNMQSSPPVHVQSDRRCSTSAAIE